MAEPTASQTDKRKRKTKKGLVAGQMGEPGPHNPSGQLLTTFTTPSLDQKGLMQVALRHSLTGGSFIDTKFYAFSRRRSTGVVDEPLPVYANSAMLRAGSKYFDGFFDGSFKEAKLSPLRGKFPTDEANFTKEYDYDSDSDLEDELQSSEDEDPQPRDEEASIKQESERTRSTGNAVGADGGHTQDPLGETALDASVENYGRVIVIPDVAFTTWKALIFWIYTGEIAFAPLKSQGIKADSTEKPKPVPAPQCSPKSMYRLADKCGFDDLKQKAETDILSKLSSENIMVELCSAFTSTYEKIRDKEVEFACQAAQRPTVNAGVPQWIADMAAGVLPHTASTLIALFQQSGSPTTAVSGNLPTGRTCGNCGRQNTQNMNQWYRYCNSCGCYNVPY